MKKVTSLFLSLAMLLALTAPAIAAPMPVVSYYAFQPDGTPYHYYSFGDELFYNVRYDDESICAGYRLAGLPREMAGDGWVRDTALINGQYQIINTRYKLGHSEFDQYPDDSQEILLRVTAKGQNGPAGFDGEKGVITLYMKPGTSLKNPDVEVIVTSLGYRYFQGPVWWSLTNDPWEKAELAKLFDAGLSGDTLMDKSSWEDFETAFNASMENSADLSKETWLTVCGGTVGGYFWPVFAQYKLVCSTADNPQSTQPLMIPGSAEFDKRLLYQANIIFNFTDYTKKPVSFLLNDNTPPEGAVAYNEFLCAVSREYLATVNAGDDVRVTALFADGTKETALIHVKDTTASAFVRMFDDVSVDTTAWEFISPLAARGILESGGTFEPDRAVTYSEFYTMLNNAGADVGDAPTQSAVMPAVKAEELLFDVLKSAQYSKEYQALNKQHLWQSNVYGDLDVDDFAFLDMVLADPESRVWGHEPDETVTFTRAKAAEVIYRFTQLIDYARELDLKQNPTVSPTASKILVDGKAVEFDAYNIGGNNYFKLRDLAFALDGTEKQFGVSYDASYPKIDITTNTSYVPVGGEMSSRGSVPQKASMNQIYVKIDENWFYFTVYNIGGNNYFKLRDICETLDIGVSYDEEAAEVSINTALGYIE